MGITRDNLHKRRATGGKKNAHIHKRMKHLGRQPSMTRIGDRLVRPVRGFGGTQKQRALRLDAGNFSWSGEAVTRKTRILNVGYHPSSNELIRTNTLTKHSIVQVDATPYKLWYEQHYGILLGKKRRTVAEAEAAVKKAPAKPAAGKKAAAKPAGEKKKAPAKPAAEGKKAAAKPAGEKKAPAKPAAEGKKKAPAKPAAEKKKAPAKPAAEGKKKAPAKPAAEGGDKKKAPAKPAAEGKKKDAAAKKAPAKPAAEGKKKAPAKPAAEGKKKAPAKPAAEGKKKAAATKKVTAGKEGEKKVAKKTEGAKRAVTKKPRPQIKKVIKKKKVHTVVLGKRGLKLQAKRADARVPIEHNLEEQFNIGRLWAMITTRPGQSGRADGYILEGKELDFYLKKMQKKKGK